LSTASWFVVHTKPRKESLALENLLKQGYVAYCPQTVIPRRRRQQWQKVSEPLFPRYLFVQLNVGIDNFSPIRSTFGVIGLVKFGSQPALMPDEVVEAIQKQESELGESSIEHPFWQKGDELEVLEGPFAGLKGVFQKKESMERVSLLLDILGRQNRFSVPVNYLATSR